MDAIGEWGVLFIDDGQTTSDTRQRDFAGAVYTRNTQDHQWNIEALAKLLHLSLCIGAAKSTVGDRVQWSRFINPGPFAVAINASGTDQHELFRFKFFDGVQIICYARICFSTTRRRCEVDNAMSCKVDVR